MAPLSSLVLKNHFFTLIAVEAAPGGNLEASCDLVPEFDVRPRKGDNEEWEFVLFIQVSSKNEGDRFAYSASIRVQGLFEVLDHFPANDREKLITVNGLSILYGACREMLLTLTARCVHGALSLPSISFTQLVDEESAKPKKKVAKRRAREKKA